MYNLSFTSGIFPAAWGKASIVPLLKAEDPTDVNKLRPVSFLPLHGKIAERIAHGQISDYLESKKLYNDKQGGVCLHQETKALCLHQETIRWLTD